MKEKTKTKTCPPSCYVCGQPAGWYRQRVNNTYTIVKCARCGLEYTSPVPTARKLKSFYADYKDIRAERKIVELNAQEHLKLLKKYGWSTAAKTLDFGAGTGVFVETAGKNCYGVELQYHLQPRIKQSLIELSGILWDFITLWGVLEHLPQPMETVSQLVKRLKPSGILVLTTVDAEGTIPYYYKPPEHLSYWTREAFAILVKKYELKIIEYEPFQMFQLGSIYAERLLSRIPSKYCRRISSNLQEVVFVPTNEIRVAMRRK